ncbi:hypothetical protein SNOG_01025 [Parastagonospora nodorum SN15]|uniref:Uncharacterized protein n=1 Tax=Phaeosphaeria nodorum (strain SN15 / ATCC MYA-4574 / FGSC 10173) TaxID=321614 RepID=Q0V4N9_PHANO|nr:hypothetical protein SNOG_01025 [Parastagonospora nodorum SN15]EAT92520.1 hypothetical protein SNOG_01025 [Parastagonospora nodorum SN15]
MAWYQITPTQSELAWTSLPRPGKMATIIVPNNGYPCSVKRRYIEGDAGNLQLCLTEVARALRAQQEQLPGLTKGPLACVPSLLKPHYHLAGLRH